MDKYNYKDSRKRDLAYLAEANTLYLEKAFKEAIEHSANDTKVYDATVLPPDACRRHRHINIVVEDIDSVSAIKKYANGHKTAVLNFASFKHPGGSFLNGSKAQEECLCHRSFLYNVLKRFDGPGNYYDFNRNHPNKALYYNRALYSPDIYFFDDYLPNTEEKGIVKCDVITCAAPNFNAAKKYCNISVDENNAVLRSRINYVMDIAIAEGVDTLILGAYGCGVFGQNAYTVASYFKEAIDKKTIPFSNIIFAIPDREDGNYKKFIKVFN